MTNADRIRAMTDEELSYIIGDHNTCSTCPAHSDACEKAYEEESMPTCAELILDWLKQEVSDGSPKD